MRSAIRGRGHETHHALVSARAWRREAAKRRARQWLRGDALDLFAGSAAA